MIKKIIYILLVFIFLYPENGIAQLGNVSYSFPSGYTFNQIRERQDIKADASDNVWVAFKLIGLGKLSGGFWTMYDTLNSGIPSKDIRAVDFDMTNNVWVGTLNGLAKYDGFSWTIYNTINSGLPSNNIRGIAFNGGDLWIGTIAGAVVFDGTNWNTFSTSNSGIAGDTVLSFAFGGNGKIWMGTTRGLSEFYNNTWTTYNSTNSGLPQQVNTLIADVNNDLWISAASVTPAGNVYLLQNGIIKNYITQVYDHSLITLDMLMSNSMIKNAQNNVLIHGIVSGFTAGFLEMQTPGPYFYYSASNNYFSGPFGAQADMGAAGHLWIARALGFSQDSLCMFDFNTYTPVTGNMLSYVNSNFLDINKTKALIHNRGDMHWNFEDSRYESPQGSGKHSVFASALWVGGLDGGGNVHLAAQTYRQTGFDYWPGPLDTVTGTIDTATSNQYDKIWKINRGTIANFIANFLNGNVGNGTYPVPPEILTWPAQGTGNISRDLAPFVDYNSDGIYNPYDGDYPLIKGDQMLFWIFNDILFPHTQTGGLPFGFEIHGSAYSYYCPTAPDSEDVVNYSTFYNYRIINRSSSAYNNLHIGLWSDMEIGDETDDFSGCDSLLNYTYTYNHPDTDNVYGPNPPMQNQMLLKGPLADPGDGIDNDHDGTTDEPGERNTMTYFLRFINSGGSVPYGNPTVGNDYYNYLHGLWRDGTPMTYGGNGYGGTTPVDYLFTGVPYSGTGWDAISAGDTAEDVRNLLSTGPFTLAPGEETSVDWALVFTWDSTSANGLNTSIARNIQGISKIKYWYDNNINPSCWTVNVGISQPQYQNDFFEVYPNPVHEKLYIEIPSEYFPVSTFLVTDITGRIFLAGKVHSGYIPVVNLIPGIYFVQVKNGEKVLRKKFIKD